MKILIFFSIIIITKCNYFDQKIEFPGTIKPTFSNSITCDSKLVMSNYDMNLVSSLSYIEPFWDNLVYLPNHDNIPGFGTILKCDKIKNQLYIGSYNSMENNLAKIYIYEWGDRINNWEKIDEVEPPYNIIASGFGKNIWVNNGNLIITSHLKNYENKIGIGQLEVYKNNIWLQSIFNPLSLHGIEFENFGLKIKCSLSTNFFILLSSGNLTIYNIQNDGSLIISQSIKPPFNSNYDYDFGKNVVIDEEMLIITDGYNDNKFNGVIITYKLNNKNNLFELISEKYINYDNNNITYTLIGSGELKLIDNKYLYLGSPNYEDGDGKISKYIWNKNTWDFLKDFNIDENQSEGLGNQIDIVKDKKNTPIIIGNTFNKKVISFQSSTKDKGLAPTLPPFQFPIYPTNTPITKSPSKSPSKLSKSSYIMN